MDRLGEQSSKGIFGKELFKMGETSITLTILIEFVLIIIIFFVGSKILGRFLRKRILPRFKIDAGSQYNIIRLLHYCVLVLGMLFALNVVGIQLTSLAVVFGLIGVGIAFGLQKIGHHKCIAVIIINN